MSAPAAPAERAFMNPDEIGNIAESERDFWWYRGQRAILSAFLEPFLRERKIANVLEAGCGTGFQSAQFEADYGWQTVPVDLEFSGLTHARDMGLSRSCQADAARLPFADASFDAVVSLDVIVHFPLGSEAGAFRELTRVLRPGGLFVVRVSALDALRSRHSQHAAERQRFTRQRLVRQTGAAGIELLRCTYANSLLLPAAFFKFRVWEPLRNAPPASGVLPTAPWLNSALYRPLSWEARLIGAGCDLPLGQSLLLAGRRQS